MVATASALALSGLAAPTPAAAVTAARAAARTADPAAATSTAAAQPILLINGDLLQVSQSPRGGLAVRLRSAASPGGVLSLHASGLADEIPADALPYIGHGLDPSLFEVSALERAESSGRLPVHVSFAGRRPALPGVTYTSSGTGSAEGYLTAAGAAKFGAALARQFRRDHARGSYGGDGLFAHGVNVSLPGAAATRVGPTPQYRLHTLTMTASNLKGKPDTGDLVIVLNATNWQRFGDPIESENVFYRGQARFSVPAGHYWAIGDFVNASFTAERLVVLPQFNVKGNATVHLSEASATSEVSFATPRPATPQMTGLTFDRVGVHSSFTASWSDSGISLWVSPTTRKPTVGTLRTYAAGQLTSPAGASGTPYAYNLAYTDPRGIIPAQHYVVSPSSLATDNEDFYQDVSGTGGWCTFGGPLVEGIFFCLYLPVKLPTAQIQYFSAAPAYFWETSYVEFYSVFSGGQSDAWFSPQPNQQFTESWNEYPLHPQPDAQLLTGSAAADFPQFPSAFRTGNTLSLAGYPTPFTDNYPGHLGAGYSSGDTNALKVTGSYAIYAGGKLLAHGNPANGIPNVRLSAKPANITFELTATRHEPKRYKLSTASDTTWTWRSKRQPSATVPDGWYCGATNSGTLLQKCAVQPLLTLAYQVSQLAANGTAPSGQQQIGLSVGHLQLAPAATVSGATAQVSVNGGTTWSPATVTATGGGNFRITFAAPAGAQVSLRVIATDSAGGSITETIQDAYDVAS
jgi:hypothetical protein